ncbi:hypothetical protein Tco_0987548 [Tanacetum coccineum]
MLGRHFVGRLAEHFGLVIEDGLWGLTVVVAPGLERQQGVAADDAQVDLDVAEEGALVIPAPDQAPQAISPTHRTMPRRMERLEEDVCGLRESFGEQHVVLDAMSRDFSRVTTWAVGSLSQLLDAIRASYTRYGDFQTSYQRRTIRRTDDASTSAASYPDP